MRSWVFALAASVTLAGSAGAQQTAGAPRPPARQTNDVSQNKNLYMIGYSHLDTQWRWTYVDSIAEYLPNTLHENFSLFEKYPSYVFNFTGARRYRMMKDYYPADYARMKQYVAKGRWYPNGSSLEETDVNVPSSESLIRNTLYGNKYFQKEFGITPSDFILPDCFGFPASLPSVLSHLGVTGFTTQKLTWGFPERIPFTVGVWEGVDGKSVIAALDPGSYNSRINEDVSQSPYLLGRIDKVGEQTGAYVDYRYYGVGDVGGAPTEGSVRWVTQAAEGDGPINVISAPADQIFHDLTPAQIEKMDRYKGELELTEHSAGSVTSQAYMKRWNRKNELLIDAAERASVAASWLGATPYPQDKFTRTWELIIGSQMHDILPGTCLPKAYEFSWNDEVVALNSSASTLQNAVGAVARGLDTRAQGVPLVVYNPLSVEREDVVEATVSFPKAAPAAVRVFAGNAEVPSQVLGRSGNAVRVLFLARVPSVGFKTFDVRPAGSASTLATGLKVSTNSLENARYRVTLNDNGDVSQIFDKAAGRNMLSAPARLAFKFEEPEAWPAWNIDWKDQSAPPTGYVEGPAKIRVVENGPVRVTLEVDRASQGSRFVQRIRLAAAGAGDRVEFDNDINWNTRRHTLKTEFPLAVSNEMATYSLGLGTIQRPTNSPKKYEVHHHQWLDLTDAGGDYGVSVLEDSKYGSDKPNDNTLRLTLIRTPGARSYEDQATQDIGRHQALYALAGHKGGWQGQSPWVAARLNQPLRAFQTVAHPGAYGTSLSLLRTSTAQVSVSAIKKAENSNEVIVRLLELNGAPAQGVRVSSAMGIKAAREVDGQERPIGLASVSNGTLTVDFGAYSPRAFALTLGAPKAAVKPAVSKPLTIPTTITAATRDGKASKAGFDGKGNSIAAELLPSSLVSDGVTFKLTTSALATRGQKVALPGGAYNKVYVLAAAVNGDQKGTFLVDGKPVTLNVQDWSGYVGQWDNRIWDKAAVAGAKALDGGIYGLKPGYIKRDTIAWYAEHRHKADGANDIYAYSYIYKYAIPVAAGAKTLTFPNNPNIRVFAVTAAVNANDDTKPAQPLYDTFRQPEVTPNVTPRGGSFEDSVRVTLSPSLYVSDGGLRYTTDGTTPTAKSPAYSGPIHLADSAEIKVRSYTAKGDAGPVTTARFEVNDTTPPSVTGVVAGPASRLVQVRFSEPVDGASARSASSYRIEPSLRVQSAEILPDGSAVNLTLASAPAAGQSYTLAANGVKDRSPAGNTVEGPAVPFATANPVFVFTTGADGQPHVHNATGDSDVRVIGAPKGAAGATAFSGTNDAFEIANRPEFNPTSGITIVSWAKPIDWNGNRRILQKGRNDSQFRLLAEARVLKFDVAGVGEVTAPLPAPGVWHHIAGSYDGTTLRLFVDGKVVGSKEATGALPVTDNAVVIGSRNVGAGPGDHFKGDMGEIRIYDQALLPEHIQTLASQTPGA